MPALGKGQDIAHRNPMARLLTALGVQPQMATFHTVLRQITRFEEPGMKQPFVQPEFRLDAGISFARRPRQSELALQRHQRGKGIVGVNRLFDARRAGLEGLLPIVAVLLAAFAIPTAVPTVAAITLRLACAVTRAFTLRLAMTALALRTVALRTVALRGAPLFAGAPI
jgi:hypothetical protein